ncbi:MAG: extradiol ring-cleavage dioxygenase [Frankiales bacterium]|nr:extradiol ring-cleavage dioxygenase [Frankiales bacterium]
MARIVFGVGTSHSPLLNSPAEDYARHADVDRSGRKLFDKDGIPRSYGELVEMADPAIVDQLRMEVLEERAARCNANIDKVAQQIEEARLDTLIVIGDDQKEQYDDDNLPAVLIYWGDTIENELSDVPEDAPAFWRKARSQYHEDKAARSYPVDAALARHLIATLMDRDFDIAQSKRLGKPRGEGHAFGFVHRRLMPNRIVPIVPVALNTYYPPNQPRPARCYALGQAIREAVSTMPGDARVGILASGGLSHFAVDEDLDRMILNAMVTHDADALRRISTRKLNSGSSEIRNWITVAGATEHLSAQWHDYVPCYRSAGGTGCGMGFLTLS